ncbi:RNA polymerase sigma factor SigJ [Nonomuraea sediminis]|uniref:RNA polymerase sigma factor SigJ n=1 Tax=Nonomuraea sediminis TaxID=2835864 RepID=UPI001BDD0B92|nr:RNA polymerase sigma factor SigJ [Nonomuraea sediminis]
MDDSDLLAERFEEHRAHLRSVAYRMLGSVSEAEDAVQEAWIRLSRSDVSEVQNLVGWLTTVVGRIGLDMLRSRESRREEVVDTHVPDPIVTIDPEQEVVMADSVGLALMVVLEMLAPAERLAFVLHDMFAVPFDDIAAILGKSAAATRQLASRARRRVQDSGPVADPDVNRKREIVSAFVAASQGGDFEALVALLDPDVVLRADAGASSVSKLISGAAAVAGQALTFQRIAHLAQQVLINGTPGLATRVDGQLVAVMDVTIVNGKIAEINILADPVRLAALS